MKSVSIILISLAVIVLGGIFLTVAQAWPSEAVEPAQGLLWLIPIAYFTMLIGAGGMAWGLIKRNRI